MKNDSSKEINRGGYPSLNDVVTDDPWVFDFTEESSLFFHEKIMRQFNDNPYRPIIIHINSYGGEVASLFSILDTMDAVREMAPPEFLFITAAHGKAMSAGAVLLAYGDVRLATANTTIMLHQIISDLGGSQPANEREFREVSRLNKRLLEVLRMKSKSAKSPKEMKDMLQHNLYMTPAQALEFGIIDAIGYPKIMERVNYELAVLGREESKNAKARSRNSKAAKSKK